jgi:aromatic-L-amino-acid decarboxylase
VDIPVGGGDLDGPSPLELDPETMRRLGYRVVDVLVERIAALEADVAGRVGDRSALDARFAGPPLEAPGDFEDLLGRLLRDALPYAQRTDHPRFLAYVPGAPTWPAVLGELLASGHDVFGGSWVGSSGPTVVELAVIDWFKEWLGAPSDTEGLLTSGGSEANLLAILCARNALLGERFADAVLYLSEQAHSSVERAARAAGLRADQLRLVEVDERFRLRPERLARAVEDDRAAGRTPFLVVASAGATSTGAIDPFPGLADVCAAEGLWLHADAAYGGFFCLTERGREALEGLARADSITLDPHKGLAVQWGTGCLVVRRPGLLADAFHLLPDYLRDAAVEGREVNLFDRGLQLTRPARGLKIWLSVGTFGVAAFRGALDRALDVTGRAERWIAESDEVELAAPASLGIVCFARRDGRDAEAIARLNESGLGHVSSTRIGGRTVCRLCCNGFRTRWTDVRRVLEALAGPL